MSVKTEPVPPSPDHTPPLEGDAGTSDQGRRLSHAWSRWFISLREKVNVINDIVAGLAALIGGQGFIIVDGDNVHLRTIKGTPENIDVTDGDGLAGDPTVNLIPTSVTPGSYTSANITVDEMGRVLAASDGSGGGGSGFFNYMTADGDDVYITEDGNDLYIGF